MSLIYPSEQFYPIAGRSRMLGLLIFQLFLDPSVELLALDQCTHTQDLIAEAFQGLGDLGLAFLAQLLH